MKKLSLIIFATLMFSACKKEYTCECTDAGVVSKTYKIHGKKKDVEKTCAEDGCPGCQYFAEHKCVIK